MIFPVKHLPQVIPIGIQTENGVESIGFDVKPWLDEFDGLELSIWPTRPGENAAYRVADENMELVGTVLYWHLVLNDTAIAGNGKVEILAITGDKRKLSGWCETNVKATSLAVTQEVPEAARPWVDEVLDAADEAKRQADRAEKIANDMSGGVISGAVRYDEEQNLTEEEKAQARKNIGADVGVNFTTDETLNLSEDGVLSVNTANDVEQDNTLPVTSAAVFAEVGNINALLGTI